MLKGEVDYDCLLSKALTNVATDSAITNTVDNKTVITGLYLTNLHVSEVRIVTMYLYGTGAENSFPLPIEPGVTRIITDLDIVISGTKSVYFKQNTTNGDVNVAVMGVKEGVK